MTKVETLTAELRSQVQQEILALQTQQKATDDRITQTSNRVQQLEGMLDAKFVDLQKRNEQMEEKLLAAIAASSASPPRKKTTAA